MSAQLEQYEGLGPGFKAQTVKYKKLLEDLQHAEMFLEEFESTARSEAESP